ncbi:hypothetical protein J0X15_04140 [Roseibium sp. CAU 1637]|uniref:Uncharacterized protein n=1 Tax=Roseibium limicola TaxID=2816037 RepID=A0A939ENU7_9HYPH|nr:hypothetical protein [Roseibium limicola]MBO0344404.1 hypothetical protein [Roseibium limicola]
MKQPRKANPVPIGRRLIIAVGLFCAATSVASAGEVEINAVVVERQGDSLRFDVTLFHQDEGWDHYADLWQVESQSGKVLAERVLLHPHVNEQPFKRSLSGVKIPSELNVVFIRARDTRHGFASNRYKVQLPD